MTVVEIAFYLDFSLDEVRASLKYHQTIRHIVTIVLQFNPLKTL